MFTTEKAKSGDLTLLFNKIFIHSRYNPVAESDTYIKNQNLKNNSRLFVLIGPGLGYLKSSIYKLIPDAEIFSIYFDKIVYKDTIKTGINYIYNEDTDLFKKLSLFISDFQLSEVKIIKWKPYTDIFPEIVYEVEKIIQQFFLERKGSIFTTGNFGQTWFRNTFLNYITKKQIIKIQNINSTIIIAASGPSLSDTLKFLKMHRSQYLLAALPSSLTALNNEDIIPDIIFHTDPGFWAKEHLKSIPNKKIPIVMPLTAAFEPGIENPVILINQNSIIENSLLDQNILKIQSHGTVAGTAYLFFRELTFNPIIFIGLDFCYKDVNEHVSPHSFDVFFRNRDNRISGYLNLLYEKLQHNGNISINNTKTNTAFTVYSGWFNRKDKLTNAYRYKGSTIKTNGLNDISTSKLKKLLSTSEKIFDIDINANYKSNDYKLIALLENIILYLSDFKNNIDNMDLDFIQNIFTKKSLLLEIFQYTSYSEIIELSHNYRNNITESKLILFKIHINSLKFISDYLKRYNDEY